MGTYTVYRLKFKTQLHLGRATGAAQTGSLGLEKTETYISADTLFSAICQMWTTFYDTASLTDFLNPYTAENGSLPFTLTSAFPYANNVYLFPKPLIFKSTSKKSKRVQFVSRSLFENIITGNLPTFDEKDEKNVITGEKVWVNSEEKKQLKKAMNEKLNVWETTTRPRVSIDRQTEESSIWHVETVQFNECCGLWFAVNYDSDETKQKIETLLRVLGDNGIGGERNAGYGLFDFDEVALEIPTAEDSTQFVTLSPICPKSSEQLEHLLKGDIAYNLNPLTGWVGSHGTYKRRKQINMFTEGSVLNASDESIGRLVDLKPDNWTHPVYRYGYAWQVGIKGASNSVGAVS
jgi:CRISPR-associated protein Csm4